MTAAVRPASPVRRRAIKPARGDGRNQDVLRPILVTALLATGLLAQHGGTEPPAKDAGKTPPPVQHTPRIHLPPRAALAHLRACIEAAAAARAEGLPQPRPARPSGAGRWLVAVIACADAGVDVPALLGLPPEDVLLLASAGPLPQAGDVALLEHAVQHEKLPLCIVLTHADCAALRTEPQPTPARQVLERRLAAARTLAAERSLPLHQAQALVQRQALTSASDVLRLATEQNRLLVVPASVEARTRSLHWHTTAAEELPMPVVR